MRNSQPIVELKNIQKSYGSTTILEKVNLTLNQGDFVVVRGKSGAGKTNLFKIIGLIESPTGGSVKLFNKDTSSLGGARSADLRLHKMGLVFQFFNLLPTLTVLENVELPMALAGVKKAERQSRALELLTYFGLADFAGRSPSGLSGGERQRVAVVRALVNRPNLILADEPTSSLDDENSRLVMNMLRRVNVEDGVSVFLTTTDLYEPVLGASADYVLRGGRLLEGVDMLEAVEVV